ncbi:MAG TPA: endonuclease/exonuclease/phosphatase family protein [Thermoanaerobaculia bacterium]|nr:endonuclease/exonuclease/phosphatase family protein [Thermoanaerobaculia bacterium]
MRRRLKRIGLTILAIVLLAVSYRVLGVYEFRSGECTASPPRKFASTYPKRLTVMTFNIEGHASLLRNDHIEEIAETIRKYDPDIVGINEAHRGTWQARFSDHTEQLRLLTGMNVVFGRSYTFLGGHFGNAVLTKGEIVSSDVKKLPGTGEPRTLLDTVIRINGGTIEFYVTHTSAWASLGRAARTDQLRCINAHVLASSHPYILAGDLNAPPETPEMVKFLGSNALKFAGDPNASTHRVMEQRLDYILIDPGWVVRSARVLDDGPSDHRPVLAELTHL